MFIGRGGNDTITKPVGEPLTEPIEADSDGDDDAFSSASEGEEEEDEAAVDREQQRARVLEAAGLLTQENSATRRRPPPPPRQRSSTISSVATTATTEAPRPASTTSISAPAQQPAVKQHADDAYDRYVRMQRDIASSGPSGPTSAPVVAEPSPAASPPSTPKPATANFLSWVSSGLARSTPSPSLSGHPTVTRVPSGNQSSSVLPTGRVRIALLTVRSSSSRYCTVLGQLDRSKRPRDDSRHGAQTTRGHLRTHRCCGFVR